MEFAEPIEQHTIFRYAVKHAVCTNERRINRAGQNQNTHDDDEDLK